ncbi:MAG: MiaB/RimO family radical SAM methylthiotransferase, partial [Calditrichaeota bacterium]
PNTFVAVVGCYAQTGSEALKQIDGIDLIAGNQDKLQIVDYIADLAKTSRPRVLRSRMTREPFTIPYAIHDLPTTRANLKIQDGCDFMCSFCIIPFARGRARSRAFWDIQREAMHLVESGFKELVLTGVNIGTYAFEGKSFLDVVKMLLGIPGLQRLRISSIEPTTIPPELLDLMADSDVLCPHLHIPVQSGSDAVLKAMKRLYTVGEFLDFVDLAVQKVPGILIGTDIMVGFPGETDADFSQSCQLLQDSPIAYAHAFTYSERQGTASSRLPGKISPQDKKARSQTIHQISDKKKLQFYRQHLGKTVRVLTEEKDAVGRWIGFSDNYIKTAIEAPDLAANQLVSVKLQAIQNNMAVGAINPSNENHEADSEKF